MEVTQLSDSDVCFKCIIHRQFATDNATIYRYRDLWACTSYARVYTWDATKMAFTQLSDGDVHSKHTTNYISRLECTGGGVYSVFVGYGYHDGSS